jgi:hypothetical protein
MSRKFDPALEGCDVILSLDDSPHSSEPIAASSPSGFEGCDVTLSLDDSPRPSEPVTASSPRGFDGDDEISPSAAPLASIPPILSTRNGRYLVCSESLSARTQCCVVRAVALDNNNAKVILKIRLGLADACKSFLREIDESLLFGLSESERLVVPIDWQLNPMLGLVFLVFPDRGFDGRCYVKKGLRSAAILSDVCEGLLFLHGRGLCHRDVKLENICVFENRGYLIDLEFVCEIGMKYRGVVGTIGYLPKELMEESSEKTVEEANDVFAVGMVGLQLFAGECLEWDAKVGFVQPLRLLETVPEELRDCFARALNEVAECRPKLIDIAAELDAFINWMDGCV